MTDDLQVWASRALDHTSRPGPHNLYDRATVLILAVDYALGRRTYAVTDVTRAVTRGAHLLTPGQRREMADQIRAAIAEGRAGMDCDTRQWTAALHALTTTPDGTPRKPVAPEETA